MQRTGMAMTTQALHNQHTAIALTGMLVLTTSCKQSWQYVDSVTDFLQASIAVAPCDLLYRNAQGS